MYVERAEQQTEGGRRSERQVAAARAGCSSRRCARPLTCGWPVTTNMGLEGIRDSSFFSEFSPWPAKIDKKFDRTDARQPAALWRASLLCSCCAGAGAAGLVGSGVGIVLLSAEFFRLEIPGRATETAKTRQSTGCNKKLSLNSTPKRFLVTVEKTTFESRPKTAPIFNFQTGAALWTHYPMTAWY